MKLKYQNRNTKKKRIAKSILVCCAMFFRTLFDVFRVSSSNSVLFFVTSIRINICHRFIMLLLGNIVRIGFSFAGLPWSRRLGILEIEQSKHHCSILEIRQESTVLIVVMGNYYSLVAFRSSPAWRWTRRIGVCWNVGSKNFLFWFSRSFVRTIQSIPTIHWERFNEAKIM